MNPLNALPGLQIESPLVNPEASNFRLPTWPPPKDFPVIIDADGEVISRIGDPTWVVTLWAGRPLSISFGDGDTNRGAALSPENADLFRQITTWWLWGPNAVQTASALAARHVSLKPLFVACSEAGILASDLSRFPKVIELVASRLSKSDANKVVSRLHDLRLFRDALGFELLDEPGLKQLVRLLPDHEVVQTAYIPPRIWTYQVLRLRECLDDYLAHREQIEACYRFCLKAYATNAGSLARSFDGLQQYHRPFEPTIPAGHTVNGRRYYGRFRLTAERFGIDKLLDRWVELSDHSSTKAFSGYLSLVSRVGLAYALTFSLMRVDEGLGLRAGCHSVERDTLGDDIHLLGDIHSLSGVTTKTIQDDDARWIVSPSCRVAIEAMTSVSCLRIHAARHDPRLKLSLSECTTPLLVMGAREPWGRRPGGKRIARAKARSFGEFTKDYPKLFDLEKLRITEADFAVAHRMTFGLDPDVFAVGEVWPLAWHQLRRTGACNMLSTGLVTDASLQYQLKQATRAMARYYGQNHYKLNSHLDDETRGYYLREMYQALAREFQALQDDRYVSPHGEKRKAQILAPISDKDHRALVKDAETGHMSYRETFLGGCAKPGPACPLGGISNITGCMGRVGEVACEWALLDQAKRPVIDRLRGIFRAQLKQAQAGSPLQASLEASLESAERAIHVIDTV